MTMRYITPEIMSELLGDLSHSTGIKFTDVSNGLAATSMLATMGYRAREVTDRPPGYITPEVTGKLPGDLSLLMGIKFRDVSRRCL